MDYLAGVLCQYLDCYDLHSLGAEALLKDQNDQSIGAYFNMNILYVRKASTGRPPLLVFQLLWYGKSSVIGKSQTHSKIPDL